jgi:hypothetical protein
MLDFALDQDPMTAAPHATPRKARNAVVRDEGLRMIGEKRGLDPETTKACKEMHAEMMGAREPTAQEMGIFFYLESRC